MSLVESVLSALEVRFLLIVKGAKDYFFLSTISALVKARLWPTQAIIYKQQVVERVLSFAQTLFTRHATCEHLGNPGMGSFKDNQVSAFLSTSMAPVIPPEFDGMVPPTNLGVTVSSMVFSLGVCVADRFSSRPGTLTPSWMCSIGMI